MAFPRLNMLSWWLLVFGGVALYASIFFDPPKSGWTAYAPLSDDDLPARPRHRRVDPLAAPRRALVDPRRDQLHRHDPQHARARHVAQPDAAVRLDDPDLLVPDHPRDRRRSRRRSRCCWSTASSTAPSSIPTQGGVAAAVAAPVLVHGPPRGLHHGAARVRDGERGRSRCSRASRSSATRRSRSRPAAIAFFGLLVWAHHMFATPLADGGADLLHAHVARGRGADRDQDLQLAGDAVARQHRVPRAAAVRGRRSSRSSWSAARPA